MPLHSSSIDTRAIHLEWSEAPWDTAIFGHPVLQSTSLEVREEAAARADFGGFGRARDVLGSRLVSCRLPHEKLRESMLLEDAGFRFIEMLYKPELDLAALDATESGSLRLRLATPSDLARVLQIAGNAFGNERFHMDTAFRPNLRTGATRGGRKSGLSHPSQLLFVLFDDEELVAFFVTEELPDGTSYWHLNAVAPEHQGKGYGRRAWSAMIDMPSRTARSVFARASSRGIIASSTCTPDWASGFLRR